MLMILRKVLENMRQILFVSQRFNGCSEWASVNSDLISCVPNFDDFHDGRGICISQCKTRDNHFLNLTLNNGLLDMLFYNKIVEDGILKFESVDMNLECMFIIPADSYHNSYQTYI